MSIIVPAILPVSHNDLESKLALIEGYAHAVQIDMVDGKFIGPPTWPYVGHDDARTRAIMAEEAHLPYVDTIDFEMDLMVSNPVDVVGTWLAAGAKRLTIHAESTKDLNVLMHELQVTYGHEKEFAPDLLQVGIALNMQTELSFIEPYLQHMDYVQFMGIDHIGKQGENFDPMVTRKIAVFRERHPDMPIQVDGGVSLLTAPRLLAAGVDRLIVGSAIWRAPDVREALNAFNELAAEYGMYA